ARCAAPGGAAGQQGHGGMELSELVRVRAGPQFAHLEQFRVAGGDTVSAASSGQYEAGPRLSVDGQLYHPRPAATGNLWRIDFRAEQCGTANAPRAHRAAENRNSAPSRNANRADGDEERGTR